MTVEFVKSKLVYINGLFSLLQKAAGRADIFHDKMFNAHNDVVIIRRQHLRDFGLAKSYGN